MDGMVIMRKWLSREEQIMLVKECHRLGNGPGGFYLPKFPDGSSMHLHMMCLGEHWDHTSKAYTRRREAYDNSTPPAIPASFTALVKRAVADARKTAGGRNVPGMEPQVCLANFYDQSGSLGMHQDKDESPSSLKSGAPVVSFSLGDSANFIYSVERDEKAASTVVLESGDVLLFGGAARMVFHAVAKVNLGSAPEWLIEATNMRPGRLNFTFRER
eukprot:TRINITY_DN15985_c0_g1_i1.p1 TRINITY_DN15985_c0_g1~~TRINITY_DN15985_c0_g1_i1.p1  ORF type:complete len:231 (-),score=33.98 TRINITY_DN15985_c0_g1_i1:26-673(-)